MLSIRRYATAHARSATACAVVLLAASACGSDTGPESGASPAFVLHQDETAADFGAVEVLNADAATLERVAGWGARDPRWSQVLDVRTDGARDPVLGSWEASDRRIRFVPRFPPVPGQRYAIRYYAAAGASADTLMLVRSSADRPATRITAVHPAIDTVPMNLLRAYITFSAPMSEGEAYRRIRLLDASGEAVPDAFLVLEHELWDAGRTRFTLLFDPGRIKRGLVPNEDLGLPLQEGNDYTLVIDADWQDGRGRELASGYRWSFHAAAADRSSPRVDDWTVTSPRAGSLAPVTIDTGEPLDQGLLERLISVLDDEGVALDGTVTVSDGGSRWAFAPAAAWSTGGYTLEIGTELEDLAGNNLRHLFDVDRTDRQDTGVTDEVVTIGFVVR